MLLGVGVLWRMVMPWRCYRGPTPFAVLGWVLLFLSLLAACEGPPEEAAQTWTRVRTLPVWKQGPQSGSYRLLNRLNGVGVVIEDPPPQNRSFGTPKVPPDASSGGMGGTPTTQDPTPPPARSAQYGTHPSFSRSEVHLEAREWTRRPGTGAPLWTTPFPFLLLLDEDGSLAPVAVAGLSFELDGQPATFRRHLVPTLYGPNNWSYKDGLLEITTEADHPPPSLIAGFARVAHPSGLKPYAWLEGSPPRGHIRLDGGWRDAVLMPVGGVLSDSLLVPRGAVLELAIGIPWPRAIDLKEAVTVRGYDLRSGNEPDLLFSETFSPTRWADRGWREVRLELEEYAGRTLSLGLSVSAGSRDQGLSAALAHPRILCPPGSNTPLPQIRLKTRTAPHDSPQGPDQAPVDAQSARDSQASASSDPALPRGVRALARSAVDVQKPASPPMNLLIILLDTVRADVLNGPLAPRVMPNLLRFAQKSLWFENTLSTSSWTGPAVYSLLSGQSPRALGLARALVPGENFTVRVPRSAPSLFHTLGQEGWQTWAYQTNPVLHNADLAATFEIYHYGYDAPAKTVTREALAWLKSREGAPFAAYLHYLDPHLPYVSHGSLDEVEAAPGDVPWFAANLASGPLDEAEPAPVQIPRIAPNLGHGPLDKAESAPEHLSSVAANDQIASNLELMRGLEVRPNGVIKGFEHRGDLQARGSDPQQRDLTQQLYHGEVRYLDDSLGRLFRWLEHSGHLEDTVVVVATDHGEEFWDHGEVEHGHSFHPEVNDGLLLVHLPGAQQWWRNLLRREDWEWEIPRRPASLIDVVPTVLTLLGVAPDGAYSGVDLLAISGFPAARVRVGEGILYGPHQAMVVEGRWKLILNEETHGVQLYDRQTDALELHDRAAGHPGIVASLKVRYETFVAQENEKSRVYSLEETKIPQEPLDSVILEQLRSLGYVQ